MKHNNKKRTAYHEAGHVVSLYMLTGNIDRIERAEICEEEESDGTKGFCAHTEKHIKEQESINCLNTPQYNTVEGFNWIFNELCYALSGGVAEMVFCNTKRFSTAGIDDDIKLVTHFLTNTDFGFPFVFKKDGSVDYPQLGRLVMVVIDFLTALFNDYDAKFKIEAIKEALIIRKTIKQEELYKLLKREETETSCGLSEEEKNRIIKEVEKELKKKRKKSRNVSARLGLVSG